MYNLDTVLERIKSNGDIEKIYTLGKTIISTDKKVKAIYLLTSHENRPRIKYAVTLSSKTGNSVWRNRFKRLIKESIRVEADLLRKIIFQAKSDLSIIFSPGLIIQNNSRRIFLNDTKPSVLDILYKLREILEKEQKVITTTQTELQIDTR
jgi:ribonuclease P protein component